MSGIRKAVAYLLLLGLVRSTVSSGSDERVIGELPWLQSADAPTDVTKDIGEGRLQFISITGYSLITPGLPAMRRFMCYSQGVGQKVLDVGSDLIHEGDDPRIRELAYKYAEAYNMLLVKHLDRIGLNNCGKGVDWDGAWDAVNAWAGNIGPGNRGTVTMGHERLRLYLNNFAHKERAALAMCDLLRAYGLDRKFTIEVSPREDINTAHEDDRVFTLSCQPRPEP